MTKIKSITVSNLKAISLQTASFNGCTALITGKNNSGKTTFLRGLFDRVRGIKPEQVIKVGEDEGFAEAELTTGEKLKWEFNDKGKGFKEKLTYVTEKDIRTSLTVELRNRFLPETFDVDKFLLDQPMKQRKTLQDLAGLDFTGIDSRYKVAYEERQAVNRSYSEAKIKFSALPVLTPVEEVDLSLLSMDKDIIKTELNDLYIKNKKANDTSRQAWITAVETIKDTHRVKSNQERQRVDIHNKKVAQDAYDYEKVKSALSVLSSFGYAGDADAFVKRMASAVEDRIDYKEPEMDVFPAEPLYIPELPDRTKLDEIDEKIADTYETNRKAVNYLHWVSQKDALTKLADNAEFANTLVETIEAERMSLIKSAKMPEGFSFTDTGIAYNDLPFTKDQLSSSGLYIGALKLASMKLGEIRCLHFDASFLDKNSLAEIEAWASAQNLQLLIERPDFNGGEIKYELINESI